ncbi:HAMP domain-containing sensor histidine kinase [Nocardioides korecus]
MALPGVRRPRTGLRLRIAVVITLIVLLAVTGLGVAVHALLVLDRVQQARSGASERIAVAAQVYRRTGLLSFDARVGDRGVPSALLAAVRRDGARATLVTGSGTRTVWAAVRSGGVVLSTRSTLRPADRSLAAVDRSLVAAGTVTVLLAALLGLLSANGLARRLRLAARSAREVAAGAEGAPSLRESVGRGRDEVGDLADAVDAMAARLRARLAQERQFTADVAHDLRTPVTGLVTAAALLDDSRPAELVRDRAAAMTTLVEDLLEVSRLDRGAEEADLETVDLAETVRRAVHRGLVSGEHAEGEVVLVTSAEPVEVLTDPRRLERVLSNLVRNGLEHGRAPVEVRQEGREVSVRDHGPGFDAALLRDGPRRFRSGPGRPGGNGLGLVIAAGQAAVLGAPLRLTNPASGGACASLVVPEAAADRPGRPGSTGSTEVTGP